MDEIKQRLKEASDACIATYEAWRAKSGDHTTREALQEAVHELRKVTARVEIELAVSDRKAQNNEPIPIPSHRASRRQGGEMDMDDDNRGQQHRPQHGGRGERDGNRGGGRPDARPVQIRRPESAAPAAAEGPQPGNDSANAPAAAEDDGRKRPLSLKRTASDSDNG